SATDCPNAAAPLAPVPVSFVPCCAHVDSVRLNTHAAPALLLSPLPPTSAMLPSADNATATPCRVDPTPPVPTSFAPCCVHVVRLRVQIHTAPTPVLSLGPPTIAVLPSEESDTACPCVALPVAPVPTSFAPCCAYCAKAVDAGNRTAAAITIAR